MLLNLRSAFTLIELLIVVAIIAILAAIAVPNFLEAQIRAKVSRTKADMRTVATGLESYLVDTNKYPYRRDNPQMPMALLPELRKKIYDPDAPGARVGLHTITTPIAYLTSLPSDVFNQPVREMTAQDRAISDAIDYFDPVQMDAFVSFWMQGTIGQKQGRGKGWALLSVGPDRFIGNSVAREGGYPYSVPVANTYWAIYDPTNGSVSPGNIFRFMGDLQQKELYLR